MLHMTYEYSIMKCTKHCLKKGESRKGKWQYNGGGELVQDILYTWMELSQ
jgi:hypothetical protein